MNDCVLPQVLAYIVQNMSKHYTFKQSSLNFWPLKTYLKRFYPDWYSIHIYTNFKFLKLEARTLAKCCLPRIPTGTGSAPESSFKFFNLKKLRRESWKFKLGVSVSGPTSIVPKLVDLLRSGGLRRSLTTALTTPLLQLWLQPTPGLRINLILSLNVKKGHRSPADRLGSTLTTCRWLDSEIGWLITIS